jgi:poly-beta-1,6-N-acetyl-D-glucosamine synthase
MWLLEFFFFLVTILAGWTLFGYFILVKFIGLFQKRPELVLPKEYPFLSIVVPCYNEDAGILAKLENLRSLDYPRDRMEVVFADGGSTDGTADKVAGMLQTEEPYRVVRCRRGGKIAQWNEVLPDLRGDIFVNTDVDAQLEADALKWLAAEFAADERVQVVGAYCRPVKTIDIESYYWESQNKSRLIESDANSASIVIAQCYAFRKGLLTAFPDDVVADDTYVAYLANTLGYRTVYSRKAKAIETRAPSCYADFLPHKFRKSNACLREALRFIYRLPEMSPSVKVMLITRVSQQLLLPWIMLFWLLVTGVMLTLFRFDLVLFGVLFLLILFIATSRVFASETTPDGPATFSIRLMIKGYVCVNLIMLATALSYPFFQQGSSYARLPASSKPGASV